MSMQSKSYPEDTLHSVSSHGCPPTDLSLYENGSSAEPRRRPQFFHLFPLHLALGGPSSSKRLSRLGTDSPNFHTVLQIFARGTCNYSWYSLQCVVQTLILIARYLRRKRIPLYTSLQIINNSHQTIVRSTAYHAWYKSYLFSRYTMRVSVWRLSSQGDTC